MKWIQLTRWSLLPPATFFSMRPSPCRAGEQREQSHAGCRQANSIYLRPPSLCLSPTSTHCCASPYPAIHHTSRRGILLFFQHIPSSSMPMTLRTSLDPGSCPVPLSEVLVGFESFEADASSSEYIGRCSSSTYSRPIRVCSTQWRISKCMCSYSTTSAEDSRRSVLPTKIPCSPPPSAVVPPTCT